MLSRVISFCCTLAVFQSVTLAGEFGSISGYIRSVNDGSEITNATVRIVETGKEVKTDFMARYLILDVLPGKYQVIASAPGYKDQTKIVEVMTGQDVPMNYFLEESGSNYPRSISVSGTNSQPDDNAYILINEKNERKEYTNRLANALTIYPGVFTTDLGNHNLYPKMYYRSASRLNVNVNGIPLNNCLGDYKQLEYQPDILAFASETIIQPGGGTLFNDDMPSTGSISIITRRPNPKPGAGIAQFIGSGNSFTTFVSGSTGKLGDFSLETGFVTNSADGIIEKNWNSSMSYYFAADYEIGPNHKFEFTFLGSYKNHANRNETAALSYWDYDYAKELGVRDKENMSKGNNDYNRNTQWGNTSFSSKEYYLGKSHEPHSSDFLNSPVTYSHTPMGSINWDWKLGDGLRLNNNFYFSLYSGGNSDLTDDIRLPGGNIDFNKIYRYNTDSARINPTHTDWGKKSGLFFQNDAEIKNLFGWQGIIENKFSENLTTSLFFNFSNKNTKSFREVRNLLGGDYVFDSVENQGRIEYVAHLGDVIDYYYEGIITKYGAGICSNARFGDFSADFILSSSIYDYTNKDLYITDFSDYSKSGMSDFRFHANLNYKISESLGIFAKGGYHTSPPRYNAIFNSIYGTYDSLKYEKGLNLDFGIAYSISYFRAVLALYYNNTSNYYMENEGFMDMKSHIAGGEFYLFYKPNDIMELVISASISESKYDGKGLAWVTSIHFINTPGQSIRINVYGDGKYTASAPQKTIAFSGTVFPYMRSFINLKVNFNADNHSNFKIIPFPDENNRSQPWKIPDYFLLEAHAYFDLPFIEFLDMGLIANFYNLLNTRYIAYSESYNNTPNSAFVIFGLPFSWDMGLRIGL